MMKEACASGHVRARQSSAANVSEPASIMPSMITYFSTVAERPRKTPLIAPEEWTWSVIDPKDEMLRCKIQFNGDLGPIQVNKDDLQDWIINRKKQSSAKPGRRPCPTDKETKDELTQLGLAHGPKGRTILDIARELVGNKLTGAMLDAAIETKRGRVRRYYQRLGIPIS